MDEQQKRREIIARIVEARLEKGISQAELIHFSMEKRGLEGIVAEILSVNEELNHLMPLDLAQTHDRVQI